MRTVSSAGGVTVRAVAGTHAVLLAMDAEAAAQPDLKGFAVGVREAGDIRWQRGFKFFEDQVPNPVPGERRSTLDHPIQSFLWGVYTARPGTDFHYVIRPRYGQPGNLTSGPDVEVHVRTEDNQGTHAIYFNRGAIPSQAFADRFGNNGPADQNDPDADDVKWLSRGLLEAALAFIAQANGPDVELRVAAYEFSYPPILNAFRQAAEAGSTVRVIFEAGQTSKTSGEDTSTTIGNRDAIAAAGLAAVANLELIPRVNRPAIPHNKFILVLRNGQPEQVWTGSTNFTPSGFLGQSNVGHVVRDPQVAARYLAYWDEMSGDPERDPFQAFNTTNSPEIPLDELPPPGITPLFSPRERSSMLDWYGTRLGAASSSVMLTAAFGVTARLATFFDNDRDYLRFLLMERKNRSEASQAMLERDRDTIIALGAKLNKDAIELELDGHRLDEWYREEEHFRKQGHIFYIHTKFMLLDVLGADPLVFTGSANFSPGSLLANDENMLLIRGDHGVADVYLTEFLRLFNHLYFRHIAQMLARQGSGDPTKAAFLDPTDGWVARNFAATTYHGRRRTMFASMALPPAPPVGTAPSPVVPLAVGQPQAVPGAPPPAAAPFVTVVHSGTAGPGQYLDWPTGAGSVVVVLRNESATDEAHFAAYDGSSPPWSWSGTIAPGDQEEFVHDFGGRPVVIVNVTPAAAPAVIAAQVLAAGTP